MSEYKEDQIVFEEDFVKESFYSINDIDKKPYIIKFLRKFKFIKTDKQAYACALIIAIMGFVYTAFALLSDRVGVPRDENGNKINEQEWQRERERALRRDGPMNLR